MRYVYLLSTHDEYGAENVTATLSRDDLPSMISFYEDKVNDFAEALPQLIELLTQSDSALAGRDSHNLQSGWGGIHLHVVPLTNRREDHGEAARCDSNAKGE